MFTAQIVSVEQAVPQRRAALASCLAAILLATGLAGCDVLPKNAPLASQVADEASDKTSFPFRLIPLDAGISEIIRAADPVGFSTAGFFRDSTSSGPRLGPGDVLSITVLEPASGGLFSGIDAANVSAQGAKIVTLPDTQVDMSGMISFPFVGSVRATGKTPNQLGAMLEDALKAKTIQPQVIVRLSANLANKAVVGGAVKVPGEFDLTPAGESLLQLISRAGGPAYSPSDTVVRMTRRRETRSIRLQALVDQPNADVHLRAGDFVNLINGPRTYTMLGALGALGSGARNTDFPLPPERLSLATALGRAGGLDDTRTDLKGIFVIRYEKRSVADQISPPRPGSSTFVPIVYQIDLRKVGGFFLAEHFALRERDVIFLSDAPYVEVDKLLNLLRLASSPAFAATTAAQGF